MSSSQLIDVPERCSKQVVGTLTRAPPKQTHWSFFSFRYLPFSGAISGELASFKLAVTTTTATRLLCLFLPHQVLAGAAKKAIQTTPFPTTPCTTSDPFSSPCLTGKLPQNP